jgi:predicted nucleic acid-binding protein
VTAKVYLDTNVFIRAFEGSDALSQALVDLLAIDVPEPAFATSELTLAELLVHPYRNGDDTGRQRYDNLVRPSAWLHVGPVDRQVLTGAAVLRSKHRLKLPDAIHISTALHFGCELLITGDGGLDGSFSLEHQSSGQSWTGKAVRTVGLMLDTVTATAEQLRA